ncbi:hypothetical protein ACJIZ3_017395 [Penstemon smallii]|uniref:Uncharacterized protein n=1 Tax=Penstemon smallii TaxID=265156 RepID=A0ABD3SVU0_9LAMI
MYLNVTVLGRVLLRRREKPRGKINYNMTVLSSKKILQEKNTTDANSITSLTLNQKALTDVSCLSDFKNLERLDLGFNNLTSLEDLKSCVNLKWLSVAQNKLQSLKGIEGLTKLTVLNAGKNKLKSMDEVKSLVSLRALILNDNEISSVCKLDQMKELNTLVLSRNPISSIGESLSKLKSVTKLSLSNCQLQTIDSSLKYCTELKELRLAHNEIMTVPSEFSRLVKLQNLDMGNNSIFSFSNLKVLSSLINLKILNLHGNPIAEKDKLVRKVKKLLPSLRIFNSKPIDKITRKEVHDEANFSSLDETKMDRSVRNKNKDTNESFDSQLDIARLGSKNKKKVLLDEKASDSVDKTTTSEKRKKKLKLQQNENSNTNNAETMNLDTDEVKTSKIKKNKRNQLIKENPFDVKLDSVTKDEEPDKKTRTNIKRDYASMIDSSETPFMDLFANGASEVSLGTGDRELDERPDPFIDEIGGLVTLASKKKKKNRAINPASLELSQVDEIGLGGPSAWDN